MSLLVILQPPTVPLCKQQSCSAEGHKRFLRHKHRGAMFTKGRDYNERVAPSELICDGVNNLLLFVKVRGKQKKERRKERKLAGFTDIF